MIEKILRKLAYPGKEDFPFLLLVWVLLAFPEFTVQIAKGNYFNSILYLFLYFGVAYALIFFIDLSGKLKSFLRPFFFTILSVFTIANIYCLYTYRTRLTYNFIEILAATNLEETKEYMTMYIDWHQYILMAISLIICLIFYVLSTHLKGKLQINPYITTVILVCSVISVFINKTLKDEFVTWNFNFEDVADLRKYSTDPQIIQIIDTLPENIVVIIGESHSKSHSSLYGYDKETNPLLSKYKESGNLIVFENVESPAINTSNSFKYILNTYRKDSPKEDKWYKSTNMLEVLKKAGYRTYWLSNQAQKGLYNNLSSAPAMLCDTAIFIREFSHDKKYDAELADISPDDIKTKKAVIYHLMGQHILFNERYPSEFNRFSPQEYKENGLKETQKKNLAQYDNANLYNDHTINSIIKKYSESDAIVFYFPDHGLDVYKTDPEYCGHALPNSESIKEGVKIPFLIYLSDKYKNRHPELAKRISSSSHKEFCTDKFIYCLMDGIGLRFNDSDDVNKYSLF